MATMTVTDYTRVSTEAAEHFVDAYYTALNSSRQIIGSFYVPITTLPTGKKLPQISINGELLNDAGVLQKRFVEDMPFTHYEAQCVNVAVMNANMVPLGDRPSKREQEQNMSLLVQVSGSVRLIERGDGPMRGFSDSFVLVPNKEEATGVTTRSRGGEGRSWLIQTQTFRYVV